MALTLEQGWQDGQGDACRGACIADAGYDAGSRFRAGAASEERLEGEWARPLQLPRLPDARLRHDAGEREIEPGSVERHLDDVELEAVPTDPFGVLASLPKTDAAVGGERPHVVAKHLKANAGEAVGRERFRGDEPGGLGAVAMPPAVLFADDEAKQRAPSRPTSIDVGEGRGADQPVRCGFVDGVGGATGGQGQDDGLEVASGLDLVERFLIVAEQPGDFLVGVPALKRGKVGRDVAAKPDEGAFTDEFARRLAGCLGLSVVHASTFRRSGG